MYLWGHLFKVLASATDWYQLAIPLESIILKWSESDGCIASSSSRTVIDDKSLLMLKTSCWACSINFSLSPTPTPSTFSKISLLFFTSSGEFFTALWCLEVVAPDMLCFQDIFDFLRHPISLFSMGCMYYIFAMSTLASTENKATTKQNHIALCFKIWWHGKSNLSKWWFSIKKNTPQARTHFYSISAEGVQQAGFGKLRLL